MSVCQSFRAGFLNLLEPSGDWSQVTYKSAAGRSIRLDIKAETAGGEVVDIEIQRADQGAGARRAVLPKTEPQSDGFLSWC